MPALREALEQAGFADVRTYVQSGNLVLSSDADPDAVGREIEEVIREAFDLDIAVVVRTRDELAEVVKRNPLGQVAENPKRYQISFLSQELEPSVLAVGHGVTDFRR